MTKIANIGCGHWGKNLARNFHELGALAAIVDGDPQTAKAISDTYSVPTRSLDEVLADNEIEGLVFATPAETHAALGLKAIQAGKHIYVEKPLALRIEDAERLIKAANKADRVLMVGHLLQYHPAFIKLTNYIRSGELGKVQYVYSNRLSLGKFRIEENVLWSFAPHDVSMLLAITGEEPDTVSAQGASFITPGVADWCTLQMTFPGGVRGHVQSSWLHPFKEQRLVVIGSSGMLVFDDAKANRDQKLALYRHKIGLGGIAPVPQKAEPVYLDFPDDEPLKAECQHFIDCIKVSSLPRTGGEEGLAVLKVLDSAERALRESLEHKS